MVQTVMQFDQNIADRLWSNAGGLLSKNEHSVAIYQHYARWEKLRPGNIGYLKWMAANCYKHTKDARLHLSYMLKYKTALLNHPKDSNAVMFLSIKIIIFIIEHSLNNSPIAYKSCVKELHDLIKSFIKENERLVKTGAVMQPPINLFYAMMILQSDVISQYLNFFYLSKKLPKPIFDLNRRLDLKIGFVWLGVKTDPSYKCLKGFIQELARRQTVIIYFDDTSLDTEVTNELSNAELKCVAKDSDRDVAKRIYDDKVKVLINNWWDRKRGLDLFSLRPASAIVNFMGVPGRYLNTDLIQYSITDQYLLKSLPRDFSEKKCLEKSLIMPIYYQLTTALDKVNPICRKSVKRIGILARPLKLSPIELDVLQKILFKFEEVELVVICSESDLARVTDTLIANGLLPIYLDRIKTAYQAKIEKYIELLQSVDLFIDTFAHFGALSTGVEIIATGCPLISIKGPTLFSCHSVSILKTLGVDEYLLCEDEDHLLARVSEFIRKPALFQKVCYDMINGLKVSRMNDLNYRVDLFQIMLHKLSLNIDQNITEDIVVSDDN